MTELLQMLHDERAMLTRKLAGLDAAIHALNGSRVIAIKAVTSVKVGKKRTWKLSAAARAGVRGVSGINTISMKVLDKKGDPALGPGRLTSGICGNPIRHAALEFIQQARAINEKEKLGLAIIGTGGVTLPEHFTEFLNAGADIVMTATGMMWDPYLALRHHEIISKGQK